MVNKISSFILSLLMVLSLSCACNRADLKPHLHPNPDATSMPYASFVRVDSEMLIAPKACSNDDQLPNGTCMLRIEKYTGSGVFVLRSTKSSTLAYVLTARHICESMHAESDYGAKIAHRFIIKDFFGKDHLGYAFILAKRFDACILAVADVQAEIAMAPIASEPAKIGERVYNLSAPRAIFATRMVLTFDGFYSGDVANRSIFTVPASTGSSGSPVFNVSGQMISMLWSVPAATDMEGENEVQRQVMENIAFGLEFHNIKNLIKSLLSFDVTHGDSFKARNVSLKD